MSSAGMSDLTYQSANHGSQVVSGFQRLWESKQMCDTRLVAQGEVFNCHRCLLASCSDYFYTMFTEGFSETNQREVELKGVTSSGLRALLDFAYTGSITVSQANLHDVLEAASHLQFTEVLEFCAKYMKQQRTIENCLNFLKIAEIYELTECKTDMKAFILQNFIPVSACEDFKEIPLELLCELLSSDNLFAANENEVFDAALGWLEYSEDRRNNHCRRVLGHVRFGLMTNKDMEKVIGHSLMLKNTCRDILQTALMYHMNLFNQPMFNMEMSRMRSHVECLAVLGAGYLDNTLSKDVLYAQLNKGKLNGFDILCPVKIKRYFAAVVVLNDFIYIVGGQTAMAGDGSHATNTAFRYNPRDDKWLQISSMTTPRTHFALIALNGSLIAVGGKHNRVALYSAEKYDFTHNEWTPIPSLPNTLFSHAGCCHMNKVYISGGCPGEDFTDVVHCYDPSREGWQLRSPMNQSRGYHVMVTMGNKIFACAGNTNAGDRRDVKNTECYDVELDQWTILTPSRQGQSEAPAVKCNNKIFILGGYSWNAHSFQDAVQCYDLERDAWEEVGIKLPEPMTGLVACHLKIPRKKFEDTMANTHNRSS